MTQHVQEPTHKKGAHDLVISKGLNISKFEVSGVALSDSSLVLFQITIHANKCSITKWYITENTGELFIRAFSSTFAPVLVSVSDLCR